MLLYGTAGNVSPFKLLGYCVTAPPVLQHSRSDMSNHFQDTSSLNVFMII